MYNFNSTYIHHASKTLEWLVSDTQEHYEYNLIHNYQSLEKFGWINKKIEYKFNSLGFRCNEFDQSPSAMFLGCSFTVGIGLREEEVWASIVSKNLGLSCINLGQGGGSPDTAFRMCLGYIENVKPKIIFYLHPPGVRLELIGKNHIEFLMAENGHQSLFYKEWIAFGEQNAKLNAQKNKLAIEALAIKNNCKFIFADFVEFPVIDYARDLNHSGPLSHHEFAKNMLLKI